MNILFDPLAKLEYGDAVEYYEAQEEDLGKKFSYAIWEAIRILESFPEIGEEVRPDIRKILLRRFPYKLIYAIQGDAIYIIAVAHGHREPDYWTERM